MDYLNPIASQLGISPWLLAIIFVWSAVWKLLAMWKASKKNSPVWFVALFIINTIGILEILYIYVFSEMDFNKIKKEPKVQEKKPVKKTSKKSKKK